MYFFFKRIFDFSAALVVLLLLSPVLIFITIALIIANSGKPFFFQKRPGKDENIFQIVKFKSMTDKKGLDGKLLPDAQRITKIGQFIRKTSLDEIPQLFNVLSGKMSLIGPRPLRIRYLQRYNKHQKKRHNVKPGITGWAQVNGRNAISWQKKFDLDVWYVENVSFFLDIKILLLTIKKVFKSEGISADNHATMAEFMGN